MAQKKRRRLPLSEDSIVDAVFADIVYIIENVLDKIYRKVELRDSDDRRKRLYGFLSEGHKEAYVTHNPPHHPATKNLIHESLHALYPDFVWERRIRRHERNLWKRLTDDQKRFLRQFVPKHVVKKEPPAKRAPQ